MNYSNFCEALDSGTKVLGVDCERFSLFLVLALTIWHNLLLFMTAHYLWDWDGVV